MIGPLDDKTLLLQTSCSCTPYLFGSEVMLVSCFPVMLQNILKEKGIKRNLKEDLLVLLLLLFFSVNNYESGKISLWKGVYGSLLDHLFH